jgi:hypothetical protein
VFALRNDYWLGKFILLAITINPSSKTLTIDELSDAPEAIRSIGSRNFKTLQYLP